MQYECITVILILISSFLHQQMKAGKLHIYFFWSNHIRLLLGLLRTYRKHLKEITYQHNVLHVISQKARVVQRVFGFLELCVHRTLFYLVLYSPEEFVERLSGAVLNKQQHFNTFIPTDTHSLHPRLWSVSATQYRSSLSTIIIISHTYEYQSFTETELKQTLQDRKILIKPI